MPFPMLLRVREWLGNWWPWEHLLAMVEYCGEDIRLLNDLHASGGLGGKTPQR
jgi:hypothetical protein